MAMGAQGTWSELHDGNGSGSPNLAPSPARRLPGRFMTASCVSALGRTGGQPEISASPVSASGGGSAQEYLDNPRYLRTPRLPEGGVPSGWCKASALTACLRALGGAIV
jgi:hypothetical protein